LVRNLISCNRLLQLLYLTYTFTAEERREKENAKREAAARTEQRKKKKVSMQQKVAQREQAGNNNRKTGKSDMFIIHFRSALSMLFTDNSN
jgi:hypothetical protein